MYTATYLTYMTLGGSQQLKTRTTKKQRNTNKATKTYKAILKTILKFILK